MALLAGLFPAAAGAHDPLFRPLAADVREDQIRFQFASFTQDFRYGTDVTDSTSRPGSERRSGVQMELALGHTLRTPVWSRLLGRQPPWSRWQLALPTTVFAAFERVESQLIQVADYQAGLALDALWSGGEPDERGVTRFDRPVLTTRTLIYHRSSHLGDEYVTLGRFGRNQEGIRDTGAIFSRPPIKRMEVSYEALRQMVSIEWTPRAASGWTARAYGGGEIKVSISRREPRHMSAPVGQLGLELRAGGNRADLEPASALRGLNRILGAHPVTGAWFAAADLRLARPFDFASCDDPEGHGEAWTPRLWSTCRFGDERDRYVGSWHAMAGIELFAVARRNQSAGGRRAAPGILMTLDWYRGQSPYGPFLDQRFRYHPRWHVVPSLTLQLW